MQHENEYKEHEDFTVIGHGNFNHHSNSNAEAEYERLRTLAHQERGKAESCEAQAKQAGNRGDHHNQQSMKAEAKRHEDMEEQYNKKASDYIFLENNAGGRVDGDTIDLHGQYVREAREILTKRIDSSIAEGQTHLHVIVGKGNHSPGHIQKIKPMVEQLCQQRRLQYSTEPNEGRMYVNLKGGAAPMPPQYQYQNGGGYGSGYGGPPRKDHGDHAQHPAYLAAGGGQQQWHQQQQQQYHGNQQPQYQQQYQGQGQGQGQQQDDTNAQIEAEVKKYLPKILRQIKRSCCTVM